MAIPAGAAADVSVQILLADAAAGGELAKKEQTLNYFVRAVAFGEWAGNGFGALAFLWATGVLLGGFCADLQPLDFWLATVIIFIEAFRIFSRNYRLDNQSLFGTTKALRWTNVSFARMLGRPQEGNEVVLIIGMWIDLSTRLLVVGSMFMGILPALTSRSQRRRRLQLWAVLTAFLITNALFFNESWADKYFTLYLTYIIPSEGGVHYDNYWTPAFHLASLSAETLTQAVAVLLLIFRPPIVANLTNAPWGRSLLPLAKVISALVLAFGSVVAVWPPAFSVGNHQVVDPSSFIIAFTVAVLSLGSLQTPAAANNLFVGNWVDVILHILFLWYLVITIPVVIFRWYLGVRLVAALAAGITSILLVVVLLIENLQIPAAVLQVLLSSLRFHSLQSDYQLPSKENDNVGAGVLLVSPNMVPAIKVFYMLALCQGSLYTMASILGLFSFFPRRSLVLQSNFSGQQGAKAIDLYYEDAYSTCMETGLFAARKTVSLASFAVNSLSSNSGEMRLAGLLVLVNLLHQRETNYSSEELRSTIISSNKTLDIRLTVARVIAYLADTLTIVESPGMLKSGSSLLDAKNQLARNEPGREDTLPKAASINGQRVPASQLPDQESSAQRASGDRGNEGSQRIDEQLEHAHGNNGDYCYWACQCWQQMKQKWSVLEELPMTHQDSLSALGMVILERLAHDPDNRAEIVKAKLAHDPDNCAEIVKATYLISNITGLISYTTDSESINDEQQRDMIRSSLNFVMRIAITGENIGVALRQELCKSPFLLDNLECVLEDSRSSPELMKLVIDILTKLALEEDARKEIGSSKMTISKLMHTFIGTDEVTNTYCYDQSLSIVAGEALNMLCDDECIYVTASLLQNVCAHSANKLRHQGAGNHLSSEFQIVMGKIMSAEGKQLEALTGLLSKICDVIWDRGPSVLELQLQTNGSGLVQKLVGTLNSNRKPNPEYPRMRRVIVELVISTAKLCPHYTTIFREGGMMEALTKLERTPSKVEKYRVFYGNVGVVLESGSSLTALVTTAKELIHSAVPTSGA
ncbi:hypothetical protein BS78_07G191600 [Paspalum vaginatum]|nr:hypothetical protein BS78_07G191600 [Paspalum vaginatum]